MIIYPNEEGNGRKTAHRPTFSGVKQTGRQSSLPVTIHEAKFALRLVDDTQDDMIATLIEAATYTAETFVGRDFIPTTYIQYLDAWPLGYIHLLRPPLQSITSIKYLDTAGVQQILAADRYSVDTNREPGIVSRAVGVSWPPLYGTPGQIEIAYTAGIQEKTGAIAGEIAAGAQTSILADEFDIEPGKSGVLLLENISGQYESVAYSAAHKVNDTYEFMINDTLKYTYPDASAIIAYNIPNVWRQGIIAIVVDMFEHPEASTEVLLYKNKTVQRLLSVNAIQDFQ